MNQLPLEHIIESSGKRLSVTFIDPNRGIPIGSYVLEPKQVVIGSRLEVFEEHRGKGYSKHMVDIIVNKIFPELAIELCREITHIVVMNGISSFDGGFLLAKYWHKHGYTLTSFATYEKTYYPG